MGSTYRIDSRVEGTPPQKDAVRFANSLQNSGLWMCTLLVVSKVFQLFLWCITIIGISYTYQFLTKYFSLKTIKCEWTDGVELKADWLPKKVRFEDKAQGG